MNLIVSPQQFEQGNRLTQRQHLRELGQFFLTVIFTLPFSALAMYLHGKLPLWPSELTPSHPLTWLYFLTVIPFSIYLSVAVHELGHALIARLLGYRIVMFTVGMIGIANEAGGLRFRRIGKDLLALRGSTIALSTSPKLHRLREMFVLSGGIAAQLGLLWLLLQIPTLSLNVVHHPWFVAFIHSLALITFAGLCGSAVPIKVGQTETDAFQMWQLLLGDKSVQRRLQLQRLTGHALAGLPYAALAENELQQVLAEKDGSRQEYAANLLAYLQAIGNDKPDAAATALNQVLHYVQAYPAMRSATWPFLYAAEYELAHGRGVESARHWLSLVQETDYSFLSLDFRQVKLRIEAAILLKEGKRYEAAESLRRSFQWVERRIDRASVCAENEKIRTMFAQMGMVPEIAKTSTKINLMPRFPGVIFTSSKTLVGFALLCILFSAARPLTAESPTSDQLQSQTVVASEIR